MIKHEARGGLADGLMGPVEQPFDEFVLRKCNELYRAGLQRGLELAKEHAWVEMGGYEIVWDGVEKAIERE